MCLHVKIFSPVQDHGFIGACDCVAKRGGDESSSLTGAYWHLSLSRAARGFMRKLLLSESGNLYLALQVARYGLCLGALQFRLQCVLLHGGGEWG